MPTSGTHLFATPQSELLIRDAYERVGILESELTQEKVLSAQRSLNFILQSWINKGLNLWTVKQAMLTLVNNQSSYILPPELYISDILEATLRTSNRNLGGTAFSSSYVVDHGPDNAFDGDPLTYCQLSTTNGNIGYQWTNPYAISMVGIQSYSDETYTLVCEYSNDGTNWNTALAIPAQVYPAGNIRWFVIPVPTSATYFRVRETGGATLIISELYFNTMVYDTILTRISRAEYISYPNKQSTGRPSCFYVDRQINPVLYVWLTPNQYYNNFFYTYVEQIEDIGTLINSAQIPARFLEALCSKLAHMLSLKENIDLNKVTLLGQLADQEYTTAAEEDRERVPLRIYGDYMQGWTQV